MDSERWQKIKELYKAASTREPSERASFLDEVCQDDPSLRAEIEGMLSADEGMGDFLEPSTLLQRQDTMAQDRMVGIRIGQYQLTDVISSGGMGTVYEADQEHPRRKVAIKIMKAGIASESAQRRFEHESEILAKLRHPGIAQVFEAGTHGEAGGVPYFVMEYIPDARSITDFAREKGLSLRDRLQLFLQVCEAVYHGHQKGIIHRDLKPANILVDAQGQVKIIDFGVARATDSDLMLTTQHTDVGQLIGTVQYMSPEQCKADPLELDTRSDVYALGVVLYELLCEKFPYEVDRMAVYEATRIIREHPPERPSTTNRALRGDVETIVLKALEKERDRRYQSAEDLRRDIHRYLEGESIMARPPSAAYQLKIFTRRHKALVGGVIAVFLVLVVGILISTSLYLRADHEAEMAKGINDYFTRMLSLVDPIRLYHFSDLYIDEVSTLDAGAFERDASVAEMIRVMVPNIDETFSGKPELKAKVHETLGMTFFGMGRLNEAEPHLQKAMEIRQSLFGDGHLHTLRSKAQFGNLLRRFERLKEAEELLRSTLKGFRKFLGEENRHTLSCARLLGEVLSRQRKFEECEQILFETMETQKRVLGEVHRETIETMNEWVNSFQRQYRFHEFTKHAQEIHEICRLDRNDYVGMYVEQNFAFACAFLAQYEQAAELYESLIDRSQNLFGKEHWTRFLGMRELAQCLRGDATKEKREKLYHDALEGYRKTVGNQVYFLRRMTWDLAHFLARLGKYDEVEGVFLRSAESCTESLGEKHPTTIYYLRRLAAAKLDRGKHDEAEKLYRKYLTLNKQVYGEKDPKTANAMLSLAWALRYLGKIEEARDYVQKAIDVKRGQAEGDDPDAMDLAGYAELLMICEPPTLQDPETALQAAEAAAEIEKTPFILDTLALACHMTHDHTRAVEIQRQAAAAWPIWEPRKRLYSEWQLIKFLVRMGDREAAIKALNNTETWLEGQVGKIDKYWWLIDHLKILMEEGMSENAEPILRKGVEYFRTYPTDEGEGIYTAEYKTVLGYCLASQGRFEEAEKMLLEGYGWLEGNPMGYIEYELDALKWLVKLYEDWGKMDKAAEWRLKLPAPMR